MRTNEHDLIVFAATSLPEIIALPVARWSVEDVDPRAHPAGKLKHLWYALERIDAFLGLLAALEYVRDGHQKPDDLPISKVEADRVVDSLCRGGPISWGTWKNLRQACVSAFVANPDRMFCPQLIELDDGLTRRSQASKGRDALSRRNSSAHGKPASRDRDADDEAACRDELLWLLGEIKDHLGGNKEEYHPSALRLVRVLAIQRDNADAEATEQQAALSVEPMPTGKQEETDDDQDKAEPRQVVVEDLTGSQGVRPRYRLRDVWFHGRSSRPGELALLQRRPRSGWLALSLFPLYAWLPHPDEGEVSQYLGKVTKHFYHGLQTGKEHAVEPDLKFDAALSRQSNVIKMALEGVKKRMNSDWKEVLASARAVSSSFLDQLRNERIYVPEAFVERKQAQERVAQFLDAAVRGSRDQPVAGEHPKVARLLLVTGMAGAGKTTFLCQLAVMLQQSWELVPTTIVTAASLESLESVGRGAVGLTCLKLLGLEDRPKLAGLLDEVGKLAERAQAKLDRFAQDGDEGGKQKGRRRRGQRNDVERDKPREPSDGIDSSLGNPLTTGVVLLLVDGLDRAGDPGQVLENLHRVVSNLPGFVCIATIARPILQGLVDRCAGLKCLAQFGGTSADNFAVSVGALDDADAGRAWESYRKQPESCPLTAWDQVNSSLKAAARNPLLLRMACEAYHGREIPLGANEVDVLREHAQQYIWSDFRRAHFVRSLVKSMWEDGPQPVRRLKLAQILTNPHLREGSLDASGPLAGLERDHVLVRVPVSERGTYDAPDYAVEFAFDALLGYLFFALVGKEADGQASPDVRIMAFAKYASTVAPLGYSMDLVLRSEFSWDLEKSRSWLQCVECLLRPDVSGTVPETQTSCVARFLAWIHAQRPQDRRALLAAMEGGSRPEDASEILLKAEELFAHIQTEYGGERQAQGTTSNDWMNIANVICSQLKPHPRAVCGVAEHLAERDLPVLAGYLADRLLVQLQEQDQEATGVLAARRLRAVALFQAGSAGALQAALKGLNEVSVKAKQSGREDEHRDLQRLIARIHQSSGEIDQALDVVGRLLDKGVHTREWKQASHAENVLLWAELMLSKDPKNARAFLGLPKRGSPPRPKPERRGWQDWWETVRADLDAVCKEGTKLWAWRTEIEARIAKAVGVDSIPDPFEHLVRAMRGFQSIGATAETADALACLTEWAYDMAKSNDELERAVGFGKQACALADAAGATKAWFLAAEWEARAMLRIGNDPTAAEPSRIATEALARALDLGHRHFLAQSLAAVSVTAGESRRHSIAADSERLVVQIYEQVFAEKRVSGSEVEKLESAEKLAYHLGELSGHLLDLGLVQEAEARARSAWELAENIPGEAPWSAVFLARALGSVALTDQEPASGLGGEACKYLECYANDEKMAGPNYRWQFARAEALALLADKKSGRAAAQLDQHAKVLSAHPEVKKPGTQAAFAKAVIEAWQALIIASKNPALAMSLATSAHDSIGSGDRIHLPVASYAHVLALLQKADSDDDSVLRRQASDLLNRARSEVEAEYPEFYPARTETVAARKALEAGNVIVRAIMRGREFLLRDEEEVATPSPKTGRRRRPKG